jgi:glyoxylase-like metal-dependent hydrolase (beta-lactamase superfamily II)
VEPASHPEPLLADVAPGITSMDTGMAGQRELNSVYVIAATEPCLVEAGPGSDGPTILDGLDRLGLSAGELAHVVVTHIHMDHAGGAGALLERFPRATVWVHEAGARHLVDPTRLVASTARTYGEARMRALYGDMLACPADRVRAVSDGDTIQLGNRALHVMHTPGHASHHVALHEDATGALLAGEAIGSYLPWGDAYRPALPPPEVDVEAALATIERMRRVLPSMLLTSHFGRVSDPDRGFERAAERIRAWADTVRDALRTGGADDDELLVDLLTRQARAEFEADAREGVPFDLERYDALGSIRMNAQGLARYWRKRWEAKASAQDN